MLILQHKNSFVLCFQTFYDIAMAGSSERGRLIFCKLWLNNCTALLFFFSSSTNLVFLSLERYLAISNPMKYNKTYFNKKVPWMTAGIWVVGAMFFISYAVLSDVHEGRCLFFTELPTLKMTLSFLMCCLSFFVPGGILCVIQYRMIMTLRRAMSTRRSLSTTKSNASSDTFSKANWNVIKTLIVVIILYIVCWTLHFISLVFLVFNIVSRHGLFVRMTMLFVVSNSCVNPFIYALTYKEFKDTLRGLLCSRSNGSSSGSSTRADANDYTNNKISTVTGDETM